MSSPEAIKQIAGKLAPKLPADSADIIARWIVDLKVSFKIKKPRLTKLGDFRPPHLGKPAQITVNADLNKYAFLITTIHEFAHLGCYLKYKGDVMPHGAEWKSIYRQMLIPFFERGIFPDAVQEALKYHISNPSASSCSCPKLSRALAGYDRVKGIMLEDLKLGDRFIFQQKTFEILGKKRTRFLCLNMLDGRKYLISERAQVSLTESVSA